MFKNLIFLALLCLGMSWQAVAQQDVQLLVDGKPFDQSKTFFTNHTSLEIQLGEGVSEEGISIEISINRDSNRVVSKVSFAKLEAFHANAVKLASKSATSGDLVIVKVTPKNSKSSVFVLKVRG